MDNENVFFKAFEKRRYERYTITHNENEKSKINITVEGEPVRVLDFSVGGLCFVSDKRFSERDTVHLSIDLENKGNIELKGIVVRSTLEPHSEKWRIAIDLSNAYNLRNIHKA
jgi:hypothetical protein